MAEGKRREKARLQVSVTRPAAGREARGLTLSRGPVREEQEAEDVGAAGAPVHSGLRGRPPLQRGPDPRKGLRGTRLPRALQAVDRGAKPRVAPDRQLPGRGCAVVGFARPQQIAQLLVVDLHHLDMDFQGGFSFGGPIEAVANRAREDAGVLSAVRVPDHRVRLPRARLSVSRDENVPAGEGPAQKGGHPAPEDVLLDDVLAQDPVKIEGKGALLLVRGGAGGVGCHGDANARATRGVL